MVFSNKKRIEHAMKPKRQTSATDNRGFSESDKACNECLMIKYYRMTSAQQDEFLEKAWPLIGKIVRGWMKGKFVR